MRKLTVSEERRLAVDWKGFAACLKDAIGRRFDGRPWDPHMFFYIKETGEAVCVRCKQRFDPAIHRAP